MLLRRTLRKFPISIASIVYYQEYLLIEMSIIREDSSPVPPCEENFQYLLRLRMCEDCRIREFTTRIRNLLIWKVRHINGSPLPRLIKSFPLSLVIMVDIEKCRFKIKISGQYWSNHTRKNLVWCCWLWVSVCRLQKFLCEVALLFSFIVVLYNF